MEQIIKGICIVCGGSCEGYCHYECAITYQDARANRIKKLMAKYGETLTYEQILVKEKDLE